LTVRAVWLAATMKEMQYRTLGRTGLRVSEIALGTVELGLDYGIGGVKPEEQAAAALLHFALDQGVNLIDTARAYGSSEDIIGRALERRRGEYILASKIQSQPGRPGEVRRLVEASLADLRTGYIDIMMVHCRADEVLPDADTLAALSDLREAGKIGFIGASVYGSESALACIRHGAYDCLEIAASALDRRSEEEVLPAAEREGVGIIARSVLLRGALTSRCRMLPAALDSVRRAAEALAAVAGSMDELPALAYRYLLSQAPPHSLLVGTADPAELRACLDYAARGPLTPEQVAAIRRISVEDERWLNPGNWPES